MPYDYRARKPQDNYFNILFGRKILLQCYASNRGHPDKFLTSFVQASQSDSEIVFEWAAASSMRIELQLIFDRKTTDSATDFYNKDIYTARNIKSKYEP